MKFISCHLFKFSWNRDKTEEIEEVDLDERAESKTRKGHLSQKQYHFFSVKGNLFA